MNHVRKKGGGGKDVEIQKTITSPCIYPTISDCELVKKEQTIKIKESDIIKIVKKIIKEQK